MYGVEKWSIRDKNNLTVKAGRGESKRKVKITHLHTLKPFDPKAKVWRTETPGLLVLACLLAKLVFPNLSFMCELQVKSPFLYSA